MDGLAGLNPEQVQAARQLRGPLRIIAGAGTGKTKTITYRIANQVHEGVFAPHEILAITFTDQAAAQVRERVHRLGVGPGIRATTIHSAAWAQVRFFWTTLSDRPVPEVLTSPLPLLAPIAQAVGISASDLATAIDWAANADLTLDEVRQGSNPHPLTGQQLADAIVAFQQAKAANAVIDYHDMLHLALQLGETDAINQIRERYKAFTVDEFQDTNALQWRVIQLWDGGRGDLCVVGDPNQSIFGFTGASPVFLERFTETYPEATTIRLTRSYRAAPRLVAFTNQLIAAQDRLLATRSEEGRDPRRYLFDTDEAEREGLITRIAQMVALGLAPNRIAILLRLNSQIRVWEHALWANNLPVMTPGLPSLYAHRQTMTIIQALRGAYQQMERIAASRPPLPDGVALVDAEEDQAHQLFAIAQRGCHWTPTPPPPDNPALVSQWQRIHRLLTHAQAMIRDGLPLDQVFDQLEHRFHWAQAQGGNPEETPPPSPGVIGAGGAIQVMTYHKAKGAEFDVVFMPSCEHGLLPLGHATSPEAYAEERRLFYVGVTRAKDLLVLSSAQERAHPTTGARIRRQFTPFVPATSPLASNAIPG